MGLPPPPVLPMHLYFAVLLVGLIFYPQIVAKFFDNPLFRGIAAVTGHILNMISTVIGTILWFLKTSLGNSILLLLLLLATL